jgi:hypothetical protein
LASTSTIRASVGLSFLFDPFGVTGVSIDQRSDQHELGS